MLRKWDVLCAFVYMVVSIIALAVVAVKAPYLVVVLPTVSFNHSCIPVL